MILLVADIANLKADPSLPAMGAVLEAKIDKGRGNVATVLVQNGTLKVGDNFIAGAIYGKVRAMFDELSNLVKEAGPSTPVEVLGLQGLPHGREIPSSPSRTRTRRGRWRSIARTSFAISLSTRTSRLTWINCTGSSPKAR